MWKPAIAANRVLLDEINAYFLTFYEAYTCLADFARAKYVYFTTVPCHLHMAGSLFFLSKILPRSVAEILPRSCQDLTKVLLRFRQDLVKILPRSCQDPAQILPRSHWSHFVLRELCLKFRESAQFADQGAPGLRKREQVNCIFNLIAKQPVVEMDASLKNLSSKCFIS